MDRRNFLKGAAKSAVAIAALPIAASAGTSEPHTLQHIMETVPEWTRTDSDHMLDATRYAIYQTEFGPLKVKTNAAKQFDARLYATGSIGDLPNAQNV